jgi:hypothetical protein
MIVSYGGGRGTDPHLRVRVEPQQVRALRLVGQHCDAVVPSAASERRLTGIDAGSGPGRSLVDELT